MALYDGSIRIDSKIDERGFNRGIASMTGTLKKLSLVIGVTFGALAVVNFGKASVQAASDLAGAMVGLQSVVEGTGNSFVGAKAFIDDYVKDGLVPATNAITAYKNLLMRGYDTTQIEKVLTALKDSASFGRQGSLSMGQAIQSATEGLKNENSILVDNAGVTKNVSMMWKEYAKAHGLSLAELTKEQKIMAEVNGIMEETRFQTGDAAKLTKTYAGQVAALGVSWNLFKVSIGKVIIPVIQAVLPYIRAAVDAMTVFVERLATIVSILFGVDLNIGASMNALAEGTDAATDAQTGLTNALANTKTAAKGALAAFDQLNVLQQSTDTGEAAEVEPIELPAIEDSPVVNALEELTAKVTAWRDGFIALLQPAIEAFGRVRDALTPLGQAIWEGLKWGWDNILVPLGEWAITDLLPVFLDLVATALEVLGAVIEALRPLGIWLWENFLKPLGEWAGQAIVDALKWLVDRLKDLSAWISKHQKLVEVLVILFLGFAAAILLANVAISAWALIAGIASGATAAFAAVVAFVTSPIGLVVIAIGLLIAAIVLLVMNWDWVKQKASEVWTTIKQLWFIVGWWFSTYVAEPVKKVFQGIWDFIKSGWTAAFTGVRDFLKNVINSIIGLMNGMNRAIVDGLNFVINGLNSLQVTIPEWVPGLGGGTFSLAIPPVNAPPQIPYLATGAVIPPNAQFMAILGDQRNGTNIEAPEGLIRKIINEELAGMPPQDVRITFGGSLGALVRELKPHIDRENTRVGASLIKQGVTS